jgi:hypothetical protein
MNKILYTTSIIVFMAIISISASPTTLALTSSSTAEKINSVKNIREKVQNSLNNYAQNVKNNQDIRNRAIEGKPIPGPIGKNSAKLEPGEIDNEEVLTASSSQKREIEKRNLDANDNSTTSLIKRIAQEKRQLREQTRSDLFVFEQKTIARQLTQALNNLRQIAVRIQSRIEKSEQSGHNMTKAKTLLAIAKSKIEKAQVAINAFASYSAVSTSTPGMILLDKPRKMATVAQQAIKEVRDSLNNVLAEIAHSMGNEISDSGGTSTSTPPRPSKTIPVKNLSPRNTPSPSITTNPSSTPNPAQ